MIHRKSEVPSFSTVKIASLAKSISLLAYYLFQQRRFLSRFISPVLANAALSGDGSLSETDFKKINHYYGLAVPAVLGQAFCALRGRPMTLRERWASTCQGAMTGLFDDFFDKDYLDAQIVAVKISEEHIPSETARANEKLFTHFYETSLAHVEDPVRMRNALLAVHEAQVKSGRQTSPSTSSDELWQITAEKGGTSILFYRTAFTTHATADENELLYHLGATMQLANDIFDVYKDREQKIRTLMTETTKVNDIRQFLQLRIRDGYALAYALPIAPERVRRFLALLSIGIFSRCFVCLDHLEKNEKETNDVFDVKAYSRKQLICDMDTKKNMLRSAAYHMKTFF